MLQTGVRGAPELAVTRCLTCGLVSLAPLPTADTLAAYYATEYRTDYQEPPLEERYVADVDEARTRVRRLMPLLSRSMRLLEVGSGSGAFVEAVRPYVKSVAAVEPDEHAGRWIESRLQIDVHASMADVREFRFEVIAMFHVLEHVLDPVGFLREAAGLLQPGGKLAIEVPNVEDALVSVYQIAAYKPFYYKKAHLYYFSATTLGRALEAAGCTVSIEGIQRYDLSNHLRWALTGEPGGQGFYGSLFTPATLAGYADGLTRAGRSDTLWALAEAEVSGGAHP